MQNSSLLENPKKNTLGNGCLFYHSSSTSVTCQLNSIVVLAIGSEILNTLCVKLSDLIWLRIFFLISCASSGTH